MYFDDITNEELQYYHGLKVPNFTIKLTDVLHKTSNTFDNKLFKIEEITTDKLYRIYPLFNTGRITSSNPNDKIIDDKVILAEKTTDTTYLTFISDETSEVQDCQAYGTYYTIGDTLTTAQYNSIVSLIRQFEGITRNLTYDQNTITGTYGKYDFSIKTGFTDKGILINNSHLTTETDFHIKLSNAVFNHSTYTVKMTALRLNEINIMDEEDSDEEPETIPVEVELTNGEYVHIPTTDLEAGDILLYDMTVEIKHDKPIITGAIVTGLTLTANKDTIQTGDTATLTMKATDLETLGVTGKTIKLYKNDTLLDTLTTDSNGECTYTYTGLGDGADSFQAKHLGTVTSSTCVIYDCLFYDPAVDDAKASSYYVPSAITVTYDNGTKLTKQASGSTANKYYLDTGLTGDWEAILNITSDGAARIGVRDSDGAISVINKTFDDDLVRVRVKDGSLTIAILVDDEWVNQTLISSNADLTKTLNFTIYLYNTANELNVTYKDLKVYPI